MSKEVLLRRDWPLQPEESVVLHAGLPQVLTGPVVHHVKAQQSLPGLVLLAKQWTTHSVSHFTLKPTKHQADRSGFKSEIRRWSNHSKVLWLTWLHLERLAWMLLQRQLSVAALPFHLKY